MQSGWNFLHPSLTKIIVIFFCFLTLLGSFIVILCFCIFSRLKKGLFGRMILYITICSIIMTIGILMSGPINQSQEYCQYFVTLKAYGALCLLFWNLMILYSIRIMFRVHEDGGYLDELLLQNKRLERGETSFILICFGLPLLLVAFPLFYDTLQYNPNNPCFCEFSTKGDHGFFDSQVLIIWLTPFLLFVVCCIIFICRFRTSLINSEDNIYITETNRIVKQQLRFPIISLICSIGFTISNIEIIFDQRIGEIQSTVDTSMMAIWGFLNTIVYLSQEQILNVFTTNSRASGVSHELVRNSPLYDVLMENSLQNSIGETKFYRSEQISELDHNQMIKALNKNQPYG